MHCGQGGDHKIGRSDVVDQIILTALDENLFLPMRNLAKRTCIPITLVLQWLTNSIDFVVKHLRWISHKLNDAQLVARIQMLNELLRIVYLAEHQD
jgi:hypothetical protein